MTWLLLDGIALAVLVLFLIFGRRRGFVAMALLLLGTLFSFWVAQHFAQPAARWVYDTYTHNRLVEYVDNKLQTGAEANSDLLGGVLAELDEELDSLATLGQLKDKADGFLQDIDLFSAGQSSSGEVIPLPEEAQPTIDRQNQVLQQVQQGSTPAEALVTVILQPLVLSALEIALFVLLFVAVGLVVRLVIHLSRILNHLPLLGGINRFLGGLCGLAEGLVVVYLAAVVLRLVAASNSGGVITPQLLEQTYLLSFFI